MYSNFCRAAIIAILCFSAKASADTEKITLITYGNIYTPIKITSPDGGGPGPAFGELIYCNNLDGSIAVPEATSCGYSDPNKEGNYYSASKEYSGYITTCPSYSGVIKGWYTYFNQDTQQWLTRLVTVPSLPFTRQRYIQTCRVTNRG